MQKLLVVDDDPALRRLMHVELSDAFEVIDSGEPEQGLALALEHRPDAILLDLRMPKYSGYELLQTFTALAHTRKIPVIIVSGEAGGETKVHCKELGAFGYFEKPIDFEALRTCLNQITRSPGFVPRAEVRVALRVPLTLRTNDGSGNAIERDVTTENVSLSGFLCSCMGELSIGSIVAVYLAGGTHYVGKAEILHSDTRAAPLRRYGARFTEKTNSWVLQ